MSCLKRLSQKIRAFYHFLEKQVRIDPIRLVLIGALIALSITGLGISVNQHLNTKKEAEPLLLLPVLTLSDFESKLNSEQISNIQYHTLNNGTLLSPSQKEIHVITFKNNEKQQMPTTLFKNVEKEPLSNNFYTQIVKQNISITEGFNHKQKENRILDFVFFILYLGFFVLIFLLFYRAGQDLLIGKSFTPKTPNFLISFDDIIGYQDVKKEFQDVIDRLKYPDRYAALKMTPLKGILLTGPPGVGKTLFAKALANESSATFLYATGSDFVELYVGVGARRARAIFQQARASTPAVIFIDEIDALGSRGGYGMDSERLSTINQMLAEMDGMNENNRIIVIGATNHPEKLDPALLRPGRFDKTIQIPSPNFQTRIEIFQHYLKETSYNPAISLDSLAHRSTGFSGAQIFNVVQESKTNALRRIQQKQTSKTLKINLLILQEDFDLAFDTLLLGHGIKSIPQEELERIAVHELGHALTSQLYAPHLNVQKVSIEGRGQALGFTLQQPNLELNLYTQEQLASQICIFLAGRAAESVIFGSISSGSKDDLYKATQIATHMVCELGFGKKTGLMHVQFSHANLTQIPSHVQEDIKYILDEQMNIALRTIEINRPWIQEQSALLLKFKTLDKNQLFENSLNKLHPPLLQITST